METVWRIDKEETMEEGCASHVGTKSCFEQGMNNGSSRLQMHTSETCSYMKVANFWQIAMHCHTQKEPIPERFSSHTRLCKTRV